MVRIDGDDYRHRDSSFAFKASDANKLNELENQEGRVLSASLDELVSFLGSIHQSRYAKVSEQFNQLIVTDVRLINDQFEGIRFVSFIDRCYEAGVSLAYTGLDLGSVFRADHVEGAYRKKYLRCLSRLAAMCSR
jgi:cell division protein ZapE